MIVTPDENMSHLYAHCKRYTLNVGTRLEQIEEAHHTHGKQHEHEHQTKWTLSQKILPEAERHCIMIQGQVCQEYTTFLTLCRGNNTKQKN